MTGVQRRFQIKGEVNGVTVIDDYGHHPTEIAATLAAARSGWPARRIVLAFQPHRYTRTRDLLDDFASVLSTADVLVVLEVYAAGEDPIAGADGRAIARAVRSRGGVEPVFVESLQDLIPVLDGVLGIDDFQLEFSADRALRWQVNGLLRPVSLSQLSLALGWPELSGKLSGVIPDVRYDNGNLEVGGILRMRVFDGEVTLRNLTLEQPFGLVPRLQVDARADNIDLETLTRTFSFGRIEGRLDGRVDGLDMESWRPVAFDAEFATPENDSSRHRISQKAVDNISSIGGAGVGGALSRSFMRFFEDFPYQRLGIRCRLENGICDMGGVAPAAEGYYLVKGRLIPPRLDVIGYADRVNWDTLMAQIMAVTGQQDMIVE